MSAEYGQSDRAGDTMAGHPMQDQACGQAMGIAESTKALTDAADLLRSSASGAVRTMEEVALAADLCRESLHASVLLSLEVREHGGRPEAIEALLARLSISGHRGLAAFRRMGGHASAMVADIEGASTFLRKCADALERQKVHLDAEHQKLQAGQAASAALMAVIDQHVQQVEGLMSSVQSSMDTRT